VQPAVGDPDSAGGLDWVTHRGPFQPLPFCGSVVLWIDTHFTCREDKHGMIKVLLKLAQVLQLELGTEP